jgi:Uma2 family endonuclease
MIARGAGFGSIGMVVGRIMVHEVRHVATIATKMTVADYEKVPPPPGGRWELRHGELAKVGFPKREHYNAQRMLAKLLEAIAGPQYVAGIEIAFRPLPEYEVWGADVGVVSLARWKAGSMGDWLTGSPEIVIEILSPSNTASEMLDREETCMAGGCLEFWTVDTGKRKVRVTRRDAPAHIYKPGDSIPLTVLGGDATLEVAAIFDE